MVVPLNEEQLAKALENARQQGLPYDWNLALDGNGRKRWSSGGSKPKSFAYLQRALDYINGNTKASISSSNNSNKSNSNSNTNNNRTSKATGKKRSSKTFVDNLNDSKKKSKKNSSIDVKVSSSNKSNSFVNHKPHSVSIDPETSLDIQNDYTNNPYKYNRIVGTVHWDPTSIQGAKVGHRIRVWSFHSRSYDSGRIVRYDPITHQHKIVFFHNDNDNDQDDDTFQEKWLFLHEQNYQLGGRFVWALVKGFAWWPAQVLYCHYGATLPNLNNPTATGTPHKKDLTTQPMRDGYVLVEFFDSDEVASIKDSPDLLRDFNQGEVDTIIRKNKKKRNKQAIETSIQEVIATREVRNDAARYYAERAFDCVNVLKANQLLGKKVEIFRSDINYPVGEHLTGFIRNYSTQAKKYLVVYDPPPYNSNVYEPTWENFTTQRYKVFEEPESKAFKKERYEPNDFDLFPFLFGYEEMDANGSTLASVSASASMASSVIGNRCRGCVMECDVDHNPLILQCFTCKGMNHPGCLDPPLSEKAAENILKQDEPWTCNKCVRCMGCRELEIAFGPKPMQVQPTSLHLPRNTTLHLCNACAPMYEKEMFCPICAHVWDDARYQHVQKDNKNSDMGKKRVASSEISEGGYVTKPALKSAPSTRTELAVKGHGDVNMKGQDEEDPEEGSFRWKLANEIKDSWYYPENNVWGYIEGTMLSCEKCNLWVHAGCAELTKSEYEMTTQGDHPVYSREYLCRKCCKEKCLHLMMLLREEDTMYLFSEPVTDQMAHNYSDVIKNPMDLRTISERALIGNYKSYAWLRGSFELMVYNALLFNPAFSQFWKEAKRFYFACKKEIFAKEGKGAPASKYKEMIKERFELAEKMVQAEKDRVKTDKTAEKKDLVAGDQVLSFELGPLVIPADPPSCVATSVVRMTPMDAFYSTWLECCFSCGSSGALDTMLYCVDCGEAYHSFCASAPIHSMNDASVEGWRCPNCKLCEISGEVTSDELKLIYCEMCDRAFTIDLISPPLEKAPTGIWICGQCVDCTKCKNTSDDGEVSRRYWSRNPNRCFPCGGCDGLGISGLKEAKCTSCKKVSRDIDGLPQCTSCDAYIHKECDKTLEKENSLEGKEEGDTKYVCPRCRKKAAIALKRKADALKATKSKSEKKGDSGTKYGTATAIKRYVPSKHLSKDDQKNEALQVALQDAQSRGLPEGWSCFYGAGNRKRWRSPPPTSRVFDSVPKALQYVERVKDGIATEKVKRPKKETVMVPKFTFFQLRLDLEPSWFNRERGYDKSTSLMSDAEVLLKVLETKIGLQVTLLFDSESHLHRTSPHVHCISKYILARAGRFVRFVKRLRHRSTKNTRRRGLMNNLSVQMVVCKMASAFVYSACIMFKVDIQSTITSWQILQSFLSPVDNATGTVHLEPYCGFDDARHGIHPSGLNDNVANVTLGFSVSPIKKPASYIDETMAQIQYHQLDASNKGVDHVPLTLQESKAIQMRGVEMSSNVTNQLPQQSRYVPINQTKEAMTPLQSNCNLRAPYITSQSEMNQAKESSNHMALPNPYSFMDQCDNDFNIANALMTLASPARPHTIRTGTVEPSVHAFEHTLQIEMPNENRVSLILSECQQSGIHPLSAGQIGSLPSSDPSSKAALTTRKTPFIGLKNGDQGTHSECSEIVPFQTALEGKSNTTSNYTPMLLDNTEQPAMAKNNMPSVEHCVPYIKSNASEADVTSITNNDMSTVLPKGLTSKKTINDVDFVRKANTTLDMCGVEVGVDSKVDEIVNRNSKKKASSTALVETAAAKFVSSNDILKASSQSIISTSDNRQSSSEPSAQLMNKDSISNNDMSTVIPKGLTSENTMNDVDFVRKANTDPDICGVEVGVDSKVDEIVNRNSKEKASSTALVETAVAKSVSSNYILKASSQSIISTSDNRQSSSEPSAQVIESVVRTVAQNDSSEVELESKILELNKIVESARNGSVQSVTKLGTNGVSVRETQTHNANTGSSLSPKKDELETANKLLEGVINEKDHLSLDCKDANGNAVEKTIKNTTAQGNSDNIAQITINESVLKQDASIAHIKLPWFTHDFVKVKPVKGWEIPFNNTNVSDENRWFDSRTCCLCNVSGDDDAGVNAINSDPTDKYEQINGSGRLLPLPAGGWIHTGCAIWSSEVWETQGGVLNGVSKAKTRGMKLRCFGCGRIGATLGCHRSVCNANFHYPCAKACGVVFTSSHKLYCAAHKQYAKDDIVVDFSEEMKVLRVVDESLEPEDSLCYRSGTLIVHSLGKIEGDCDGFHSKSYITPPGFASTRIFWSFVKPKTRTVYMMRIVETQSKSVMYTVTAADAPTETFQSNSVAKVYNTIMKRVWELNKGYFSHEDLSSVFPMARSKKNKNAFCLNGPQFFGFGINFVRKTLEAYTSAVSCAVPLTTSSTPYEFCFHKPTQETVMNLQRKRAVIKAEKALENVSGCARTEGSSAVDKSKGSGRITRALVRKSDDDPSVSSSSALAKGADASKRGSESTREFESIQAKYREMKSVPMEERLAAKRSHIHGWGLFAKRDYPKNSMIAEYMGEAICQPIADKREKKYEELGMGSCYMFRLDLHEIVDATNIGCMARFMNHCCTSNAYANVITANTEMGLIKKIVVFANQDIKIGDEITYDYKFAVEDGSLRCTCGAPNCIGRMN